MSQIVKCSINENVPNFIVREIIKRERKNRSRSKERISVRQLCLEREVREMANL